jgi:CRP/FNR family transcriptional regulator, cyclic AMP receptor protein
MRQTGLSHCTTVVAPLESQRPADRRSAPPRRLPADRADQIAAVTSKGFLASLSPGLGDELIGSAPLIHYPAGSVSTPTRDASCTAVVVSGLLRQFLPTPDGRQVTIRYVNTGDLVGYPSSGSRWLRSEIEAVESSDLLHLDFAHLERLARREPELSRALADELEKLLNHAYRTMAGTSFATVRSRVAHDLLERAARMEPLQPGTRVRVTQQAIALATGSVREVVARALRRLRLEGVIETDQAGITILRVDELRAEAGQGD